MKTQRLAPTKLSLHILTAELQKSQLRFGKLNAIATLILNWVLNRTTHAARNYHENHASK